MVVFGLGKVNVLKCFTWSTWMVFNSIFVRKTFSTSITHMTLIQAFMTNVHMLFEQEISGKTFIAILTDMFMLLFSMPEKVKKNVMLKC